jgi:hypothetical protein
MRGSSFEVEFTSMLGYLAAHPEPVTARDIVQQLGLEMKRVTMLLAKARYHATPGFTGMRHKRMHYYTIGDKRLPGTAAPKLVVHAPQDLYRGWYNPATGLTGSRLGV